MTNFNDVSAANKKFRKAPRLAFRKFGALLVSSLLLAGTIIASAVPARALTVTLGNSDELVFDHSGSKYTDIIGDGKGHNNVVLYKNVVNVSGIAVDAVITTFLNNATISVYDDIGSASNAIGNFQLNVGIEQDNGSVTARFAFYEAGTYTGANTGNPVVLQNVRMTSIDIDGNGGDSYQFTEFTGFQKYTLNNPTNLTISNLSPPKVRFTGKAGSNSNIPEDKVLVKFDSLQTLDVVVGNTRIALIILAFLLDPGRGAIL